MAAAFTLLLASTLPAVGSVYLAGLLLVRRLRLTFISKLLGFLLAWPTSAIIALTIAQEATGEAAMSRAIPGGFLGATIALGLIAVVGPRKATPQAAPDRPEEETSPQARPKAARRDRRVILTLGRFPAVQVIRGWTREQALLFAAAAAVVLAALFPPFVVDSSSVTINLGYGFLFSPPEIRAGVPGSVNVLLLCAEWLGILIVTMLAWFFTRLGPADARTQPRGQGNETHEAWNHDTNESAGS